jgi:uncharacterized RDD family membrane protein YckC
MDTNESQQKRNTENDAVIEENEMNLQHSSPNLSDSVVQQDELSSYPTAGLRFAGFWMRFWAYLLDLVVIGSVERIIINPLFRTLDISLFEFNMFAPISIATAITFYLYFVLMTKIFKQTLGKMVFGLKVIDLAGNELTWGTILFREWIGRFISTTVIIGYVIVAFLPKKQALHDIFVQTSVIHVD